MEKDKHMTVTETIETVCQEICDYYCKFPAQYGNDFKSMEKLMQEHCESCALNKLY